MKKLITLSLSLLILVMLIGPPIHAEDWVDTYPRPQIENKPKTYLCLRADGEIEIDGLPFEANWDKANRHIFFLDIERRTTFPVRRSRLQDMW